MAKSTANNIQPWIKPVGTIAAIWAGWKFVVSPILEGLNLKDTEEEAASKILQEKVENYTPDKNYWSPRFYQIPPSGYVSMILTYQSANGLAKSLNDASGIFNDNESQIYAVFRQCKYKTQVSYLAYYFNRLYNKDLYNWLKNDVLNEEELQVILKMTEQLPNGYKNNVTGRISGKDDYFEKIVDSITNDDIKWAKSLYKNLKPLQKNEFWKWYEITYYYDAIDNDNPDYVEDLQHILHPGFKKLKPKRKKYSRYTPDELEKIASDYAYATGSDYDRAVWNLQDPDFGEELLKKYFKAIDDWEKENNRTI